MPYMPTFRGPKPDSIKGHALPISSSSITVTLPPASPRHTSVTRNPPILPSVWVTPSGKSCNRQASPPRAMKLPDEQCTTPLVQFKAESQSRSTIWNQDVTIHGPKSPIFPSDVFQNQIYDTAARGSSNNAQFRWKELLHEENDDTISPSRKQSYPKRQRRMSKNLLDISFDSAFLDVDTSMESLDTAADTLNDNDAVLEKGATITATTHRLVEAIGSQLNLDDKLIRSPSELVQTFTRSRSRRKIEPLPRPFKATPPLDISADSMDGLAALSTAAFLGLDETF